MRRLIVLTTIVTFAMVCTAPGAAAHARVATPQDPQQGSATLSNSAALKGAATQSEAEQNAKDYSHARIVRLSFVEGDVQIARPEDEGWEEAIANLPIRQGDSLATFRGRAEIEFESGATVRMAENTRLQFTELALADGARVTRMTLSAGTAAFYANLDKRDTFMVISPGVTVEIPRNARFRMDVRDDRTNVAVTKGDVAVQSAAGNYKLSKNDGLLFYVAGQNIQLGRIGEPDDFDRWVNDRENSLNTARVSSLRYVNAPFRYGLSDLSYHGNWLYVSSYGYVWQPYGVGLGWGPYVSGRWVFLRHHGWTWVSYEPWGWVPYHYGRWAHTHHGWVWVPGYFNYWSPAHVVWFQFGRNYGWCPLGPFDRPGPRGVWGRPHHFNSGVVVSTAGGVVQVSRNPGILRNELTGEPLNRPPTRAEVFGGRTDLGADGNAARPAGFAGTRREPDVRGGRADGGAAGTGPERAGRGEVRDDAGRAPGEAPAGAPRSNAPAGFAGRPTAVDRGDVDREEARPRNVPMSPEVMRGDPRPRNGDPSGNVEFDRDDKKFVNRPGEGIDRAPDETRANPTPRSSSGFAGSTGVPATGEPRPEASGRSDSGNRNEPRPRDVTIPRGSDSGPGPQRSEPTPRPSSSYDNNSGYSSRPSSQSTPSGGYGGSSQQSSQPRPSSQSSQPSSQSSQPRPSSPSSSTGFGGSAPRPSSPPPAAQPRPSSPPPSQPRPQSNFQSQPRPSAPPSAPAHKPRPD